MDSSHQNVVPYNPEWASLFISEAEILKPIFADSLVSIEHIGSTSIPSFPSKPIIDIGVLIKSHTEAENFIEPLVELGYAFDRELHNRTEFPERHFFRKGEPTQFHLSIAYADKAKFWPRQLAFRDYLRSHSEARDAYAKLKQELIAADPTGRDTYISGKTEFVNDVLQRAGFNQ
ncbi:MAG: GrpB family protein [Candidatus Buchananbacteria bacterium]|nr:GrpB family protein [Candidatus Buchananbacteria bacterium]